MYDGHYVSMTIGTAYITTDEEVLKKKMLYKFYTLIVSDTSVTAFVKTFRNTSRFILTCLCWTVKSASQVKMAYMLITITVK